MAKIFKAPDSIKLPEIDYPNYNREVVEQQKKKYLTDLATFLKARKNVKHVGETVNFPHADGYASYMIASIKPLELIHLEFGDAWELPYIERLTAKDIINKIEQQKSLAELFSKKS